MSQSAEPVGSPGDALSAGVRAPLHALHALVFGGAALVAPFDPASWFALGAGSLGALHALSLLALLSRRRPLAARAVRVTSWVSLGFLAVVSALALGAGVYLVELYEGIGLAVAAGLFAIWCGVALFSLPLAVWELASTGGLRLSRRARALGGAASVLAAVLALGAVARTARAAPALAAEAVPEVERALAAALRGYFAGGPVAAAALPAAAWERGKPAECRDPLSLGDLTLLVTAIDDHGEGSVSCVQAHTAAELGARLAERLGSRAPRRVVRVGVDLVTATHPLARTERLLDALKLRPARDGVCAGVRCLGPWQLVALDVFSHFAPIPKVPDAHFGAPLDEITALLGAAPGAPLTRITVRTYVGDREGLHPLERLRSTESRLTRASVARATELAERYIVGHQGEDGIFAYALNPFSSEPAVPDVGNIARQSGTSLVLCELGSRAAVDSAARALTALSELARDGAGFRALSLRPERASLGHSALALIAMLSCRKRPEVAPEFREQITGLAGDLGRFVLRMQRPDGSFYDDVALPDGAPSGDHESLFGAGQAIFGLVLLDEVARAEPRRGLPSSRVLREAITRAMDHYASRHWPRALRSLFYLEENWHCLAARAALAAHRHDAYERFCLDYVAFKSRFILSPDEVTDGTLRGGYGIGPLFPLHVTPTAGFGEAMAAAIAVKRARGMPLEKDREVLARALGFVLAQQWDARACFACAGSEALGGFSESAATPVIRVDYVQHAWAALGHGGALLELE